MPSNIPDSDPASSGGAAGSRRSGSASSGENPFFAEIGLQQGRGVQPARPGPAKRKSDAVPPPKPVNAAKATGKQIKRRLPPAWLLITGVGVVLVAAMLIVAANVGSSPSTEAAAPAAAAKTVPAADFAEPSRIQFGPHSVTGSVNDRTMLSPVSGASAEVPIERHGDLMLADVKINDTAVGKFLLDTGTRDVIISREIADRLHLPARRTKNLSLPGGTQSVSERKIDSLSLGTVRFEERMILPPPRNDEWLAVAVDMKPWAEMLHLPIDGVIGGEIWSQTPFSINPARNILTFYKRGPFPFSATVQPEFLTRFDNFEKPAVTVNLDRGPEQTFLLATGAPAALMVNRSAAPVKTLTAFGSDISQPAVAESKHGDGYFDSANSRQAGVIGAGILSRYLLMFDYANAKFLAIPAKK